MWSAANLLSAFRLVIAPLLLVFAWNGFATAFLLGIVLSFLSDLFDGWLARRRHETSALGAKLDSWGDLVMYVTLAAGLWWLRPELIYREAPFVAVAIVSYVLPTFIGLAKFGRLTSYHTWGDKLSSILMGVASVLLLVWETGWLFRVAVVVLALAEIEEIAITVRLKHWRSDIASIAHVWRQR